MQNLCFKETKVIQIKDNTNIEHLILSVREIRIKIVCSAYAICRDNYNYKTIYILY